LAEVSFGEWLKRRRGAEGWTQEQLAQKIHCSTSALRKFESEERRPSAEVVEQLAEIFNISSEERPTFLRFARGDWQAVPGENLEDAPWIISSVRAHLLSNLPISSSSFIGRKKEQVEITHLIERSRLVTLTGVGGIGKSRLSLQTASALFDHFPEGIWLVELASLSDPAMVLQAIIKALELTEQADKALDLSLTDFLKTRKALLILDNCEHLIQACAQTVETLLQSCRNLHILITSREALRLAGETIYLVPPLNTPDLQHLSIGSLPKYESVQLLVERAQSASYGFSLTPENAPAVAQICQQLDGIPLALELAAGRVNVLGVEEIATRLDQRFKLLTGGSRTALPRHQTLRAMIDWSHDLLSEPEGILLHRLSVFAGSWTLQGAEWVCASPGIEPSEVLNLLNQLLNKSFILVEHKQQQGTRYRMLETIRQYAHEKLLESESNASFRGRHLAYYAEFTAQAEPKLYRSNQVFWLKKLDHELENIYSAIEWSLSTNSRLGLHLLLNWMVIWFWGDHGETHRVLDWLVRLLDQYPDTDSLRARALAAYGHLLGLAGNIERAEVITNQALALARLISDKRTEAFSLWVLGSMTRTRDTKLATSVLEKSLALYRSIDDKLGQANVLHFLPFSHHDLERSKTYLFESMEIYREWGHLAGLAGCLLDLGHAAIYESDFFSAEKWLTEAKTLYIDLGNPSGEAYALTFLGTLAFWQADYLQACAYLEEAITIFERVGNSSYAWPCTHMAYVLLRQGDLTRAKEMFRLGVQQFQNAKNIIGVTFGLEGLAGFHVNQGNVQLAALLIGWADFMRTKIGDHRPPIEQADFDKSITACLAKMGEAAFSDAYDEGKMMSLEEAIAYALEKGT
jgi:predicted ATPase/DNA-binding XRE family transcriptional regulator